MWQNHYYAANGTLINPVVSSGEGCEGMEFNRFPPSHTFSNDGYQHKHVRSTDQVYNANMHISNHWASIPEFQPSTEVALNHHLPYPIIHQETHINQGIMEEGSGKRRTKRKYVRRPKKDINAPEKPKSAYIQFSIAVRKELGPEIPFPEASKIVGTRWSQLGPEKVLLEQKAAKELAQYHLQLNEYKKTPEYQRYQKYLSQFAEATNSGGESSPLEEEQRLVDSPSFMTSFDQTEEMNFSGGSGLSSYASSSSATLPSTFEQPLDNQNYLYESTINNLAYLDSLRQNQAVVNGSSVNYTSIHPENIQQHNHFRFQ